MAQKKITKPVKPPTLAQELQALKISTNLMAQEMTTLKPMLREQGMHLSKIQSTINNLRNEIENSPDLIERRESSINPEQLNQLYAGVNKIAAYAAAMDETKRTMIKLTSKRINKLDARVTKLRVRLKRLNG
jgi:chromosome segregation ATPase